jgi:hypothetical protein
MADISPIRFQADDDPGGRDIVSGDVAGSVAAAKARLAELESDTFGQGSTIGDLMTSPAAPPPWEGPYFPETNQQEEGAENG